MSAQTRPLGSTPKVSSAGPSLRAPRLAYSGADSTEMAASSATDRSGRRTVSPATRTLPARIRAWARSRDSARPLLVTSTSSLGNLKNQSDGDADDSADEHLDRGVTEQLTQHRLLDPAHVHQVLDETVEHRSL